MDAPQLPTAQRHLTHHQRHVSASSETPASPSPTAQRPTRAPETPLFAVPHCVSQVRRRTPRQLRQTLIAFCQTSFPSLHPQMNEPPAPAMILLRLARRRAQSRQSRRHNASRTHANARNDPARTRSTGRLPFKNTNPSLRMREHTCINCYITPYITLGP